MDFKHLYGKKRINNTVQLNVKKSLKTEGFFSGNRENQPLLLVDQRDAKTLNMESQWNRFNDLKRKNSEYFKCHQLALQFVEYEVSLRKKLYQFPYYKRGKKGFVLSNNALTLFPVKVKLLAGEILKNNEHRIVLFPEVIFTLPLNYIKRVKK